MKADVKKRWVEELRSGKRKQGTDYLKRGVDYSDEPRYCCLGVLCEIAVEQGLDINVATPEQASWPAQWEFGDEDASLPESVMKWAGIEDKLGRFKGVDPLDSDTYYVHNNTKYEGLADMNDGGMSFIEIADIIEKEF